jgi:hypothetical protein
MSELREKLADQAHASWSGWMKSLFSKCDISDNGEVVIPSFYVRRWRRQCETPYAELPEHEKESDRIEADRYLEVFNGTVVPADRPVPD